MKDKGLKMYKIGFVLAVICFLIISFVGIKQKEENDACIKLLIFSFEQTSYLLNITNMTYEEFSEKFLRFKFEEMMDEDLNEN